LSIIDLASSNDYRHRRAAYEMPISYSIGINGVYA